MDKVNLKQRYFIKNNSRTPIGDFGHPLGEQAYGCTINKIKCSINQYTQCKQMLKKYIFHNNEYNQYLISIIENSK